MNTNNDGDSYGHDHLFETQNRLILKIESEMNLTTGELQNFQVIDGNTDVTFIIEQLNKELFDRLQQKIKDQIIEKYKPTGAQL